MPVWVISLMLNRLHFLILIEKEDIYIYKYVYMEREREGEKNIWLGKIMWNLIRQSIQIANISRWFHILILVMIFSIVFFVRKEY